MVRGSPAQPQFGIIFSTQSHPRRDFPESPAHTDWSHKYTQAQFSHGIGWGGVGWGWWHSFALAHLCDSTLWAHITRVQSATEWTVSVHTLHMSTCNVTRVQSATEWTASVHTLHMSKSIVMKLTTCTHGAHKIHSGKTAKDLDLTTCTYGCKNKGVHTAKPFRVYRRGPWPRVQMRPLTACTDEAVTLATLARTIRVYLRPWPRTIRVYLRPQKARAQPTPWPYQLQVGCNNPTSRGYNPSYTFVRPFRGRITPFITGRGPPCNSSTPINQFHRIDCTIAPSTRQELSF